MLVMKYINQIVYYIPQFFKAVKFLFSNIPDFTGRGGKVFYTQLERPVSGIEGNNFSFRTVIQPDGDIINFIPPTTIFKDDKLFFELYQKRYQEHYDKLRMFCAELEGLSTITKAISMILSLTFIILLNKGFHLEVEQQMRIYLYVAFWTIFTFLFQKFVSKYLFKIIVNLIIKRIRTRV